MRKKNNKFVFNIMRDEYNNIEKLKNNGKINKKIS